MSKVVVFMNLTLDGVMQAPGRPTRTARRRADKGHWIRRLAHRGRSRGLGSAPGADVRLRARDGCRRVVSLTRPDVGFNVIYLRAGLPTFRPRDRAAAPPMACSSC